MKRKPKQLDEAPTLHDARVKPGKNGPIMQGGGTRDAAQAPVKGVVAPGETDEPSSLVAASSAEEAEIDPAVRSLARQIASRLSVRRPRREPPAVRGIGKLETIAYSGASDELDLDATIDVLAGNPVPEDEDLLVRERLLTKRSVVLLVDVSGSMKGERIKAAAATVGALAGELSHDALAVVAFWSDAAVLLDLGDPIRPVDLLDQILRIPARGLTNVAFPLEIAGRQLARVPAREARVILLSDCVHNAGPDPRSFAAKLPRVDVLLDASGEKDIELGREIASRGRGTCHVIRSHRDVAPALSAIFSL